MCQGYRTTYVYPDGKSKTHIDFTPCERSNDNRPCSRAILEDRGNSFVPGLPRTELNLPQSSSHFTTSDQAARLSIMPGTSAQQASGEVQVLAPQSPTRNPHHRRKSIVDKDKVPGFLSLFRSKDKKSDKPEKSEKRETKKRVDDNRSDEIFHEHPKPPTIRRETLPRAPEPPNAAETGMEPPRRRSTDVRTFTNSVRRLQHGDSQSLFTDDHQQITVWPPQSASYQNMDYDEGNPHNWVPHLPFRVEERLPPGRRQSGVDPITAWSPSERPGILKNGPKPSIRIEESREKNLEPDIRVIGDDQEYPMSGESRDQARERYRTENSLRQEMDELKSKLRQAQGVIAQNLAQQAADINAKEVMAAQASQSDERQGFNDRRRSFGGHGSIQKQHDVAEGISRTNLLDEEDVWEDDDLLTHKREVRGNDDHHYQDYRYDQTEPRSTSKHTSRRSRDGRGAERPRLHQEQPVAGSEPRPDPQRRPSQQQQHIVVGGRERDERRDEVVASEAAPHPTRRRSHRHHSRRPTVETVTEDSLSPEPEALNARFDPNSTELTAYDKLYLESREQQIRQSSETSPYIGSSSISSRPNPSSTSPQATLDVPSRSRPGRGASQLSTTTPSPEPTPYARRRRHRRHHTRNTEQNRHSYPSQVHQHRSNNTPSPDQHQSRRDRDRDREQRQQQYWYASGPSINTPSSSTFITHTNTGNTSRYREYETPNTRTTLRSPRGSHDLRGEYTSSSSNNNNNKGKGKERERADSGVATRPSLSPDRDVIKASYSLQQMQKRDRDGNGGGPPRDRERPKTWWM